MGGTNIPGWGPTLPPPLPLPWLHEDGGTGTPTPGGKTIPWFWKLWAVPWFTRSGCTGFLLPVQFVHGSCSCNGSQPWHAPPAQDPRPASPWLPAHPAHPGQAPAVTPAAAARPAPAWPRSAWPGLKNDSGATPLQPDYSLKTWISSGCPAGFRYHVKILMNPQLSSASSKSFSRRQQTGHRRHKTKCLNSLVTRATLWLSKDFSKPKDCCTNCGFQIKSCFRQRPTQQSTIPTYRVAS